jgi:hypothetical protein
MCQYILNDLLILMNHCSPMQPVALLQCVVTQGRCPLPPDSKDLHLLQTSNNRFTFALANSFTFLLARTQSPLFGAINIVIP